MLLRDNEKRLSLIKKHEIMIGGVQSLATNGQKYLKSHPRIINFLVIIFGISAWIGVNGIYVQLPLLVARAPEGWNLAAYLVVVIQIANIGPAVYTLAKKSMPNLNESRCIFGLLFTGCLAVGILAFCYDKTSYIGGKEYSVTLFICGFFPALIGCTSSVLFMPYLRNCSEKYLAYYFIGEGLSGVLPSVVALFQGVGENHVCVNYGNGTIVEVSSEPRFSPRDYFIFLFSILFTSLCTFVVLQYLPSIQEKGSRDSSANVYNLQVIEPLPNQNTVHSNSIIKNDCVYITNDEEVHDNEIISLSRIIYFHFLVGVVCFLGNGFLPGIQTYSCLPYGNVAFHLTVTLANIANPTACLIYLWYETINLKVFNGFSFVGMITCSYAIYTAASSPNPPLRDSMIGVTLVVIAWILLTGSISYLKLAITSTVRRKFGPKALISVGVVMQSGSACGAILSFGLINYTTLFHKHIPCTPM